MLYLDNAATTMLLPEVKESMLPYLYQEFGNPSSKYYALAQQADIAVKKARKQVASLVDCIPEEIIFTSGATESNNFIIKGLLESTVKSGHIITTEIEHPSVLEVCRYLKQKGYEVTFLPVDREGRVSVQQIKDSIQINTKLVSIQWVNNEVGTIQPIESIAKMLLEKGIFFHVDATQALGKIPLKFSRNKGINAISISAHKCFGPKGIGATILRLDEYGQFPNIPPLLHGGGQENGMRSGTLAVHNIVGFGTACEIANQSYMKNQHHLKELEVYLLKLLSSKFGENIRLNHPTKNKVPGILSIQFKGLNNEILAKKLAPLMAISTGSACSSAKPSYVLQAIGLDLTNVRQTLRFSLSPYTSFDELDVFSSL